MLIDLVRFIERDIDMNNSKIPYEIRKISRAKVIDFYNLSKNLVPNEITPGQIWSTHSIFQLSETQQFQTDEPRLVVILQDEGKPIHNLDPIIVAPLSVHISMASEYDFIVKQNSGNSPLTFDFMIEVWNETPALKGQLNKLICSLSEEVTENLFQLYWSRLINTEIPENLRKYIGTRVIAEDDPRRIFQEEEIVGVNYLSKAATAALELEFEEQTEEVTETKNWLKFELKPLLGKLSDYLRKPTSSFVVARAANNIDSEEDSWLVVQLEENEKFIFELLNKHQQPYSIYLKAHGIDSNISNRHCIITIKTDKHLFRSAFAVLREGSKIEVGQDPDFRSKDVESVEVAIEK